MSRYRRARIQGGTYFFTLNTLRRQAVLTQPQMRAALREGVHLARQRHPFQIDAWVLLPDHLHCIWTLPPGDADFGIRWSLIKRHVTQSAKPETSGIAASKSRVLRREGTLWQRRFWEHAIRDEEDFERHVDYIHWNPVKHGLVRRVPEWPYSTFHRYAREGIYAADWGGISERDTEQFGEAACA